LALAKSPPPVALVPLHQVWKLALNSHLAFPPTYDESRGFFAIEGDRLVAYDLPTGKQLWLAEAHAVQQAVAANDQVYVAEADGVVALRAVDGQPVWRAAVEGPIAVRPTAGGGKLIVATKSGELLALDSTDGRVAWRESLGTPPHAPATVRGNRVYSPTSDSRIVAHDLDTGTLVWERRVGGDPNEILALDERLYAGSTDNYLYSLMTADGRIDWRWRTGGDVSSVPVADARAVYFVSFDNVVRALNQTSGGQYWMKPLPFRPTLGLVVSGGTVVVAGPSPTLKVFNAKDGTPGVDIAAGDEVAAPPGLLEDPQTRLPMLAVVTRHIVNGDSVTLSVKTIDPAVVPFAPLPNPITPAPMPATRP
jgi:outer membrane protein assembly factor BamB